MDQSSRPATSEREYPVSIAIDQDDLVMDSDEDAVCVSGCDPSPTLPRTPCRVENHDWWSPRWKTVDAILRIHGDLADTRVSEVGWKLRPRFGPLDSAAGRVRRRCLSRGVDAHSSETVERCMTVAVA